MAKIHTLIRALHKRGCSSSRPGRLIPRTQWRLGRPQYHSGLSGSRKNHLPPQEMNHDFSVAEFIPYTPRAEVSYAHQKAITTASATSGMLKRNMELWKQTHSYNASCLLPTSDCLHLAGVKPPTILPT